MANILVFRKIDIYNKTNYQKLADTVEKKFNGICPNFGNKLWYQGIISEISVDENKIEFYEPSLRVEDINERYDLLLYPMANIFSRDYSDGLEKITMFIKKLSIPVYIISCGVQAGSYDDLDILTKSIGDVSKNFIKAVYDSGGEFALRGFFTAEFFNKLGFYNPAVVGCPSLFQLGKNLQITNQKVELEKFKVDLNGLLDISQPLMKKYDSLFYDQEALFDFMYNYNYFCDRKINFYNNLKWIKSSGIGFDLVDWFYEKRVRLLADMWDWQHSIINERITFSYGTRIHGNIMAILSGVPALIVNLDARVKEMAEFYEIPNINLDKAFKIKEDGNNLYETYLNIDYSNFNRSFINKYNAFNAFLVKCGIVKSKMNSNNRFFNCSTGDYPIEPNDYVRERIESIRKNKWIYKNSLKLL